MKRHELDSIRKKGTLSFFEKESVPFLRGIQP
jgi:hypothetical protein